MTRRHGPAAPRAGTRGRPGQPPAAVDLDAVAAAARAAAERGNPTTLPRLEADVLAAAPAAPPGGVAIATAVQAVLQAWVRCRQPARAIAFADAAYAALGYDRLATPEVLLRMAANDLTGARHVAEALAAAPAEFGGHGLRAYARELLGRHDEAAADGVRFHDEAVETARALARWRDVARQYTPATAHLLAQFGAACVAVQDAFPGARPWRGEALCGETVLLRLIEGYGDQLQALRLARSLRDAGGRAVVECDAPLVDLVRASGITDAVVARAGPPTALSDALRDAVASAPAGPLPGPSASPLAWYVVVGGRLHEAGVPPAHWPGSPYLSAGAGAGPEPLTLADLPRPRVGLLWAGSATHPLDAIRALPFDALARLVAATPRVSWVSLQLDSHPRAAELARTPALRRVRAAGSAIRSFLDTARLMRHLDLVVAIDSAPVHLAGALGVPVWVLLSPSFDWRWGMDGERTPLYGSARLLRDGARGDWNSAVDRVARELSAGGGRVG
jgi:hypothetical protein